MLQNIKDRSQGWIAWLIVGLIAIPFTLVGIQSYLGVSSNSDVAHIDGEKISKNAYRQILEQVRAEVPKQIPDEFIKQLALKRLIYRHLISKAANAQNFQISDQQVQKIVAATPEFHKDGQFDFATYKAALGNIGWESGQWTDRTRRAALLTQFTDGYEKTSFVTQAELSNFLQLTHQHRDFDYVVITAETFKTQIEPTEDALKAYYQLKQSDYITQEEVKFEYVVLRREGVMRGIDATEEQLQALFETEADQLERVEERKTNHIFVLVEDSEGEAADTAAKQKAQALLARLQAGEDFAAVAGEASDDPSAKDGGFIGYLTQEADAQDAVFLATVFDLELNAVSEVIRSEFGYHIIKVTDITNSSVSFEDARNQLLRIYQENQVSQVYDDLLRSLEDVSDSDLTTLQTAADEIGFPLQDSGWITRLGGGDEITRAKPVLEQAFDPQMTATKENSNVIELAASLNVVIRVVDHRAAAPKPFEAVKEDLQAQIVQQKSTALASEAGVKLKQRLDEGQTLADIAKDTEYALETMTDIDRKSLVAPIEIRNKAFSMSLTEGKASHGSVLMADGDYALITLKQIIDNTASEPEIVESFKASLTDEIGKAELQRVIDNIEINSEIQTFRENL